MKTKLSPLEELRQEKAELASECANHEARLVGQVDYVRHNFGRLVLTAILPSVKSKFTNSFTGDKKSKKSGKENKSQEGSGSIFKTIAPFAWDILQPMLIGLVVKKIQSFLFKKKTKK